MSVNASLYALAAAAGVWVAAGSAEAAMVTADFDSGVALQHGSDQSLVNGQYASFGGLTLTFQGSTAQRADRPPSFTGEVAVFDTDLASPACGGDCDLNVGNGNALIVQNKDLTAKTGHVFDTPDDERGATIKMTVNFGLDIAGVVLKSISIIDIEENPLEIRNNAYAIVASGSNGNKQVSSIGGIDLVLADGDMVFFRLQGSGAIDDLAFEVTPVPVPAALPLLATALAALGVFGRRRRTAGTA